MRIIITDLTRFSNPDIVCIAGICPKTNQCIRPLPYLEKSICKQLNIWPGAIIDGDFVPKQHCVAPHTEDYDYENLNYCGDCSSEDFRNILKRSEVASIQCGFSVQLDNGQKHIPINVKPNVSIITISLNPQNLEIVKDLYKPNKLKVLFTDNDGQSYRYLGLTDLGFFLYAQKHSISGEILKLNAFIHAQEQLFIRVGLSREYTAPDGRRGYWLQVNGIYTFPNYIHSLRCYSNDD